MGRHPGLDSLDDEIGHAEDDGAARGKGAEEGGHAPFVGQIACYLYLEGIIRMRRVGDFGSVDWDVQGECHDVVFTFILTVTEKVCFCVFGTCGFGYRGEGRDEPGAVCFV